MTNQNSSQDTSVVPFIFLIALTVVLVFAFAPRPVTPRAVVAAEPTLVATEVAAEPAVDTANMDHLTLMALGLEEVPQSSVARGQYLFSATCAACHGQDAKGMAGLGKTLIDSQFVNSLSDPDLVSFVTTGRPVGDPLNTTNVAMPGKGGNPSLDDNDILAIVHYIRSLNGAKVVYVGGVEPTPVPTARPFTALDPNALTIGGGGDTTTEPTAVPTVVPSVNTPSATTTPAKPLIDPNAISLPSGNPTATPVPAESTPEVEATSAPSQGLIDPNSINLPTVTPLPK